MNIFTAEYTTTFAAPARHAPDPTRTMPPRPRSRIAGAQWCTRASGPTHAS
ncbi:MAG TPA: hypothetical protein VKG80_23950 [Trebonia sp.]|nr:hypothetical protein [Trebonia sp.]